MAATAAGMLGARALWTPPQACSARPVPGRAARCSSLPKSGGSARAHPSLSGGACPCAKEPHSRSGLARDDTMETALPFGLLSSLLSSLGGDVLDGQGRESPAGPAGSPGSTLCAAGAGPVRPAARAARSR